MAKPAPVQLFSGLDAFEASPDIDFDVEFDLDFDRLTLRREPGPRSPEISIVSPKTPLRQVLSMFPDDVVTAKTMAAKTRRSMSMPADGGDGAFWRLAFMLALTVTVMVLVALLEASGLHKHLQF